MAVTPQSTEVESIRDVPMVMRDGTVLRADVHLPTGAQESLPTVLLRTPYDKSAPHAELNVPEYVNRGYAVVIQDVRGRYTSEGSHYHGRDEVEDGYDTLEWIAEQQWSNGAIGMTGLSYPAAVQCAAACSGTTRLKSMFHVKAPPDYYLHGARRAGNSLNYLLPIEFLFACTSPEALKDPLLARTLRDQFADVPAWLGRLPFRKGLNPFTPVPDVDLWFEDMQTRETRSDFWRQNVLWSTEHYADLFGDTAALFVAGWYDLYREDRFFTILKDKIDGPVHLLMGPWGHRDFERTLGDVDFGPEAELGPAAYSELQLAWFDETLGQGRSSEPRSAVRVFVMGGGSGLQTSDGLLDHGGHWRTADDWPLPNTEWTPFYLHPGGVLSEELPPESTNPTRYLHDPLNPVPTIGGTSYFVRDSVLDRKVVGQRSAVSDLFVPYGPHDQVENPEIFGCETSLPLWARPDVLTFQTEPLSRDVEITGPIEATLWFDTTAVDTDFIVKLIDVYPSNDDYPHGYAMNLADGVIRASYIEGFEERKLLSPGVTYRAHIRQELFYPTSNMFKAGHRIRLQIASSDFPAYDVNMGNGTARDEIDVPVVARNTIHHDVNYPSHILLPMIPL